MLPAVNATNRWQGIEFTLPLICSGIEYKVYMCRTASISTLYVRWLDSRASLQPTDARAKPDGQRIRLLLHSRTDPMCSLNQEAS